MAKKPAESQLQTPASEADTAQKQRDAGMGGSYTLDPRSGAVELSHRTDQAAVSRKAPLKDDDGNELPPAGDGAASADTPAA
jgi:hypothetical protein